MALVGWEQGAGPEETKIQNLGQTSTGSYRSCAALLNNFIIVLLSSILAPNKKVWFGLVIGSILFGQLWFKVVEFGLVSSLVCVSMVQLGSDCVSLLC